MLLLSWYSLVLLLSSFCLIVVILYSLAIALSLVLLLAFCYVGIVLLLSSHCLVIVSLSPDCYFLVVSLLSSCDCLINSIVIVLSYFRLDGAKYRKTKRPSEKKKKTHSWCAPAKHFFFFLNF